MGCSRQESLVAFEPETRSCPKKFSHVPKKLRDSISELRSWLPNYDHGEGTFPNFIMNVLGALPGGDEADDVGYDKFENALGWKEIELLGNMLNAIENKEDVACVAAALMGENVTISGSKVNVYEDEEVPKREERNLV